MSKDIFDSEINLPALPISMTQKKAPKIVSADQLRPLEDEVPTFTKKPSRAKKILQRHPSLREAFILQAILKPYEPF